MSLKEALYYIFYVLIKNSLCSEKKNEDNSRTSMQWDLFFSINHYNNYHIKSKFSNTI